MLPFISRGAKVKNLLYLVVACHLIVYAVSGAPARSEEVFCAIEGVSSDIIITRTSETALPIKVPFYLKYSVVGFDKPLLLYPTMGNPEVGHLSPGVAPVLRSAAYSNTRMKLPFREMDFYIFDRNLKILSPYDESSPLRAAHIFIPDLSIQMWQVYKSSASIKAILFKRFSTSCD